MIVGRTNVGKSTLFNRLSTHTKSITLDYAGVTRDFLADVVQWKDATFELIDTGGISIKKTQDSLAEHVKKIVIMLLEQADVVVFLCDGMAGVTYEDVELARFIHKQKKPTIVVVNKIDTQQAKERLYEFERLGFKQYIGISAQHGLGIDQLCDAILTLLPKTMGTQEQEEVRSRIVLLGKPNVGKSTLMNLLIGQERMLVSDQAGTTREAVSEPLRFYQETIQVTDTPGIRKKRAVSEPIEKLMVKSAFHAVEHANIVLLLIDGSHGIIADQELKLAFYVFEQGKGLILIVNKADLMTEGQREALEEQQKMYKHLFGKIPVLYISCYTKKNVGKILSAVTKVDEYSKQEFSSKELTLYIKRHLQKTPLFHTGQRLVVYKVKQIGKVPITLLLEVNHPQWFGGSQLAFFDNILREQYTLTGVPIIFRLKKRGE